MNKKKLLIIVVAVGLVGLLIFLLFRPKKITQLFAGDVVATNIRFAEKFENNSDDELRYFNGSTITTITFPKKHGEVSSNVLFDHLPFGQIDKFSTDNDISVVRAVFSKSDDLLPLDKSSTSYKELEDGSTWFIIDHSSGVKPVPIKQSNISDCIVNDETVYCLVVSEQNSQSLVSFNYSDAQPKDLKVKTSAVTFIAAKEGKLLLRDYSGKGFVYKDGMVSEFAQDIGETRFDLTTGTLVVSNLANNDTSEEGGSITTNNKTHNLRVFNMNGEQVKEIVASSSFFTVSRGYVITMKDLVQPSSLTFHSIDTNNEFTLLITQGGSRVKNTLREIHIIRDDFSLIGAVTTSNQLVAYGTQRYIDTIPAAKLPVIRTTIKDYGFQYNIASNRLTVYYPTNIPNSNIVNDSLILFDSVCDCDINQIAIDWKATAFEPGH